MTEETTRFLIGVIIGVIICSVSVICYVRIHERGMTIMDEQEHIEHHKKLHKAFDELVADYISHTDQQFGKITVYELMEWSHRQIVEPEEEEQ